jgi:hypothetical protein
MGFEILLLLVSLLLIIPTPFFWGVFFDFSVRNPISLFVFLIILGIIYLSLNFYFNWKTYSNAKKVNVFSRKVSYVIFIELVVLSAYFLVSILTIPSIQSQFFNMTSSTNLRDFVLYTNNGISVLIGIITIIIIFTYFFMVLNRTKYFSDVSDLQEKYSDIFWAGTFLVVLGGFIILILHTIANKMETINILLFCIAFVNVIFVWPIPYYLKKYFYNLNLSEPDGIPRGSYSYKFLEDFQKENLEYTQQISDVILIMTFLCAGITLFSDGDLFLFLLAEYSLLLSHFWWAQLRLIPQKKSIIELNLTDGFGNFIRITDIFVLSKSSKDHVVILGRDNRIRRIMKSTIYQMVDESD